jgi:hypothetical protein
MATPDISEELERNSVEDIGPISQTSHGSSLINNGPDNAHSSNWISDEELPSREELSDVSNAGDIDTASKDNVGDNKDGPQITFVSII